jgi:hypothetical protein
MVEEDAEAVPDAGDGCEAVAAFAVAALPVLQCGLCCFQSSFWQEAEQYQTDWQREHFFRAGSPAWVAVLPHLPQLLILMQCVEETRTRRERRLGVSDRRREEAKLKHADREEVMWRLRRGDHGDIVVMVDRDDRRYLSVGDEHVVTHRVDVFC